MTLQKLGQVFACLAITSAICLTGVTQVHANPKKNTKEKTAQQCKIYTDRIDYQVGVVAGRHQALLLDEHNLFTHHNAIRNKHPRHGSYQGHIQQYTEQQGLLKQYITDATLNDCGKYVSAEAHKWKQTPAPTRPSRQK